MPSPPPGLRNIAHQLPISELTRVRLELRPGRVQGLSAAAEFDQQRAPHLAQIETGPPVEGAALVDLQATFHPGECVRKLALRLIHRGDRFAIGLVQLGLGKVEILVNVALLQIDRLESLGPSAGTRSWEP